MAEVISRLTTFTAEAAAEIEKKQTAAVQWLLHNRAAHEAAFPRSAGALSRTDVLAAGEKTNAIESTSRQTQLKVKQHGLFTLLGAIRALMVFDAATMRDVLPKGRAFSVGGSS